MLTLFDTSIWISHFRFGHALLATALEQEQVLTHSRVIGELAVGSIPKRESTLRSIILLPRAPDVEFSELLTFISAHHLYSKGLSLIDVEILASCLLVGAKLVTLDKQLSRAWNGLQKNAQRNQ